MLDPRAEAIFHELAESPAAGRSQRLAAACGHDAALRADVESLLRANDLSNRFLLPPSDQPGSPPDRLGRYPILRELGRGGMGVVYLARDPELQREVALKTFPRHLVASAVRREQLRAEARSLASVSQPNVAQVFAFEDVTREDGTAIAFLAMEYVPGANLSERIGTEGLPFEHALDVARQIAAALEAAHARGIVHRDLKPQNVRLTPDGWVKVLDFGLATTSSLNAERGEETSLSGLCGTLGYMSPEQAGGEPIADRSDLWAFGCVLFECLSGSPAVAGGNGQALIEATRGGQIDWIRLPSLVPAAVRHFLARCLDLEPSKRPSASDARRFFEEALLRERARALHLVAGAGRIDGEPQAVHLPARLSTFIGRERALETALELLARHRLVTLVAMGGCGKTRLAIEVARRSADRFPQGVWFVDLTLLGEGDAIAPLVARTLGVRDAATDASPDAALLRALGSQRLLLVLDNCEHLLDAAADLVNAVVSHCPEVTILATSREPLDLIDEQVFDLPRFELPAPDADPALVREYEAVRLFESRARARRSDFVLDDAATMVVAEICRRLDGLPLAIELAASHARSHSSAEILDRVVTRPFEIGQVRGLAGRHQSLTGLIEWSYRLLEPVERLLFSRLSVFRGGWTAALAEEVCADVHLERWQVCDLLSRLVEQSLVEVVVVREDAASRYRFLETINAFARFQLDQVGEREELENRLLASAVNWVPPRVDDTPEEAEARLERVAEEYINVAAALEIALVRSDLGRATLLTGTLGRYWLTRGFWREGLAWLERVTALSPRDPAELPPAVQARDWIDVLLNLSRYHAQLDQHDRARSYTEAGVSLSRTTGDPKLSGRAAHMAGINALAGLRFADAHAYFEEAIRHFRAIGDRVSLVSSIGNIAMASLALGDTDGAILRNQEQIALARELGDRRGLATALNNLGLLNWATQRPSEALVHLNESIRIMRDLNDPLGAAICLNLIGEASIDLGDLSTARASLLEAVNTRLRLGQRVGVCSTLRSLSRLAETEGDPALAAELLGSVIQCRDRGEVVLQAAESAKIDARRDQLGARIGLELLAERLARGAARTLEDAVSWVTATMKPPARS
ncbi:MAG: protein kinase [Candidatus Eisenbacteria bacterium]|nr:protein kinase [Candidatus Eisenbacteria bacterium]